MQRRHAIALGATLCSLGLAGSAHATTFCVDGPAGCPAGATTTSSLYTALQRSGVGNDGQADTVLIAAGTYSAGAGDEAAVGAYFQPAGADPLTIQGAGASTVITSSKTGNSSVANLDNGSDLAMTVRDVEFRVPASFDDDLGRAFNVGNLTNPALVERVRVRSDNPGSSGVGTVGNLTIRDSDIEVGSRAFNTSDSIDNGPLLIEGSRIVGRTGLDLQDKAGGTTPSFVIRRSTIRGSLVGLDVYRSAVTLESSVVELDAPGSGSLSYGISVYGDDATATTLDARNVTLVNVGDTPDSRGIEVEAEGAQTGAASAVVRSSILRGFQYGVSRTAAVGAGSGDANVDIAFSNFAGVLASGDGAVTQVSNIDADPLFSGAGDYHLQSGSPSVETGDPAADPSGPDRDGAARVQDANGDGVARRDMGAYERAGIAPPPPPPAGPGTPATPGIGAVPGTTPAVKRCVVPGKLGGLTVKKARARLKKANCNSRVRRSFSAKRRKGRVIRTTQKVGARLKNGATVTLVVSKGRRP